MAFQQLGDAGVHPEILRNAQARSVPINGIIELINTMISIFVSAGGSLPQALINLLQLFHILPGATVSAVTDEVAMKQLVAAGVDEHNLNAAVEKGLDVNTVVTWLNNLINVVNVAGPAVIAAIAALLKLFMPIAPPAPVGPTPVSPNPHAAGEQHRDAAGRFSASEEPPNCGPG